MTAPPSLPACSVHFILGKHGAAEAPRNRLPAIRPWPSSPAPGPRGSAISTPRHDPKSPHPRLPGTPYPSRETEAGLEFACGPSGAWTGTSHTHRQPPVPREVPPVPPQVSLHCPSRVGTPWAVAEPDWGDLGLRGAVLFSGRRQSAGTCSLKFIPLLCGRDTKYSPKSAVVPPRTPRKGMTPGTSIPSIRHPHGAAPTTSWAVRMAPRILHTPPNTSHQPCAPQQDAAPELPAVPVTPWEGEAPHAGPRSPLACPRRWERPQPLPAPPAPGRRQLCRGALPRRRGLDAFPLPGRPRGAPGSRDPPSTPCHPPTMPGPPPPAPKAWECCARGVSSRAPPIPSCLGTPVVFVPPPAVGSGPPLHRKSLLMDRAPPGGTPPLPGPLAGWAAACPPNPGPGTGGFAAPRPHE